MSIFEKDQSVVKQQKTRNNLNLRTSDHPTSLGVGYNLAFPSSNQKYHCRSCLRQVYREVEMLINHVSDFFLMWTYHLVFGSGNFHQDPAMQYSYPLLLQRYSSTELIYHLNYKTMNCIINSNNTYKITQYSCLWLVSAIFVLHPSSIKRVYIYIYIYIYF